MSVKAPLAGVFALVVIALSLATPLSADAQPGPLAFGACRHAQVIVPAAWPAVRHAGCAFRPR